MLIVGLTGGIGSGKSTVARLFAKKNVPVIDADDITHALMQPGGDAYTQLKEWLGDEYFDQEGALMRHKLRELAFSRPEVLEKLEQLLHPLVEKKISADLQTLAREKHDYAIVVIPLLIESGMQSLVDRILVIDCPESMQLQRVMTRDNSSSETTKKILKKQIDREARLKHADDVIDNSGTLEELKTQVDKLDRFYRQQT